MITKRRFLQGSMLATLVPLSCRLNAAAMIEGENDMQSRIAEVIQEYSEQGIHRTGTEVDHLNADWFLGKIKALGVEPIDSAFHFERVKPFTNELRLPETTVKGVPLYDCTYTNENGIRGSVGELGSDADIAIAMSLPHLSGPNAQRIRQARRAGSHKAIVIVTDERLPKEGIALLNAEDFAEPFGPPVLQVASKHWPTLKEAIHANTQAKFILHSEYIEATARNVEAKVAGRNSDLAPIVVMTPRSGWWFNASERGGGIACFLEIMRAVQTAGAERDVIFTANTGHELGHTGLDYFLLHNPNIVKKAYVWIHLGANFAAKVSSQVRLQYSDESAAAALAPYLQENKIEPTAVTPMGQRPNGEARNIYDGGGRYVSILGGNGLFHHPSDQWPHAVDLDSATRWTKAFVSVALSLANS